MDSQNTQIFKVNGEVKQTNAEILTKVYAALCEKGYNPINQLVGYILTEDPTYITSHNGARQLICKIDKYELLSEMIKQYLQL